MTRRFGALASAVAGWAGSPWGFLLAAGVVLAWVVAGPVFRFSATWQLVINTGTTIVTFLMVFLIQHAQNRDTLAIHLKLAELLRAVESARTDLATAEDFDERRLAEEKAAIAEVAGGE